MNRRDEFLFQNASSAEEAFARFIAILRILRSPDGCPWDIRQTVHSMKSYLLEETYEALDAIESGDAGSLKEELGDVSLLVFMIAYIEEQDGRFTLADVLNSLADKLVRRHPHVFGKQTEKKLNSQQVIHTWDAIKREEKHYLKTGDQNRTKEINQETGSVIIPFGSALFEVPTGSPAADLVYQLQKAASKVGFDWDNVLPVLDKVTEELAELRREIVKLQDNSSAEHEKSYESEKTSPPLPVKEPYNPGIEEELGDLFFSVINVARKLGLHPDLVLRKSSVKFIKRFTAVEKELAQRGLSPSRSNRDAMEEIWDSMRRSGTREPGQNSS